MKLIQYTFRNLITPLLLILTAWACCFYLLIMHEVDDETNDSLENYKEIIIKTVLADSTLLHDHVDIMTKYYIREVPEKEASVDKDIFYDTTVYIEAEMEFEPVRVLRTWFRASNGKYYELIIKTSTLEKEDMAETIFWSLITLYAMLLCCILLVIHFAFRKSFRPLTNIVTWLKNYHPGKTQDLPEKKSHIEEIDILHQAIGEYTYRSTELYNQQKQFVENAAHEAQTPLAICLNKLELLYDNPDCTQEQLAEIDVVYQTLSSLKRTNKNLLLLSRIENKQFPETTEVSFNEEIELLLENFTSIFEHKQIEVVVKEEVPLVYVMNKSLAVSLISNLFRNAFIHNRQNGIIRIAIEARSLSVTNSSNSPELDEQTVFNRFARQNNKEGSTGLGLALVKSIADMYHIRVTYRYINGLHQFNLFF